MYQEAQIIPFSPSPTHATALSRYANSWVEVSKQAILHNISQYKSVVGARELGVVVKSNAYGHGMFAVAKLCEEITSVAWLCTVSLSEALGLRAESITKKILVLSYIDADIADAIHHDIDIVVYDMSMLILLNKQAKLFKKKARIHVKVDTGLSRLGVVLEEAYIFICAAAQMEHIQINGIFTHLAESEKTGKGFTFEQIQHLHMLRMKLEAAHIFIPYHHYSCTAALTAVEDANYNMARLGLGVYGLWPSKENKIVTQKVYADFNLLPALSWKTRIIQIKRVAAWSFIGYGRTFTTTRDTVLAVLPVGYWEGYDRKLSNNAMVLVRGTFVPVVGRISMNVMVIDITDVPATLEVGEHVTLLGAQEPITAEKIADTLGTINWEVVTRINPLLPRIMV